MFGEASEMEGGVCFQAGLWKEIVARWMTAVLCVWVSGNRVGRRCLGEVEMLSVVRWRHGGGRRSTLQRRPGSPLVGFARNFRWEKRVPSSAAGEVKASVGL